VVVREIAVYFAEQRDHFAVQRFDQLRGDHASGAITAVHNNFQTAGQLDVPDDFGVVAIENFDLGDAAFAAGQIVGLEAVMQGLDLLVGQGIAGYDDLEAVVVRRVMATRQHYPGFASQYVGCVVQRRRRYQAYVADVAAAVSQALDQLFDQLRARQAPITADRNIGLVLRQALGSDGATEPISGLSVEKFRDSAANVVGAENAVGEFRCDLGWGAHL